jgi:hypothetical protein
MLAKISMTSMLLLVVMPLAGQAHAGDDASAGVSLGVGETSPAPPARQTEQYYGWQMMPIDAVAAVVILTNRDDFSELGAAGYLLGGATVHALNGNGRKAVASFVVRAALPALGFIVGGIAHGMATDYECSGDEYCNDGPLPLQEFFGIEGAVAGALVGTGSAMLIDYAVFGWKQGPSPAATERSLVVAPLFDAGEHGVSLGVIGSF